MATTEILVEPIQHDLSGLTFDVVLHESKRPYFTATFHGVEFRNSSREVLQRQIYAAVDRALALRWTAIIETRLKLSEDGPATLSLDRFWTVALPGGDRLRANWREADDDDRQRLQRAFTANLPEEFETLPLIIKAEMRQSTYMPYSEAAWATLHQSAQRLRQQKLAQAEPPVPVSGANLAVFLPPRVTRYEIHYRVLEKLISEHLEINYSILSGEKWSPDSSNALSVTLDGYDDSDRAVVEQVRSGERSFFALEILMRVLAEQQVIPEGKYLITARQSLG